MKFHFFTKLLAVATIEVLWIPVCSPILSSQEWIDASQEILQDSTNQLVIKKIPNAACDKMSQTRASGCHPSDATRLAQWFFSLKCIIQCNQGFGLPLEVIQDIEVNCHFSENNTLNMTMGEIEWSAECHCPQGSTYSGSNFSEEVVSYSLMADEYSKRKCDNPAASADTVSSVAKYNEKGLISCRDTPSICDRHATCVGDACFCTPGYYGSGLECFYRCNVSAIQGAFSVVNSKGAILSEGTLIEEFENVTVNCDPCHRQQFHLTCGCDGFGDTVVCEQIHCEVPAIERALYVENAKGTILFEGDSIELFGIISVICDQLDRKMFNMTCGCDGFDDLRPCEKAVYLVGGYAYDSIAVFYPESPFKSYNPQIQLTKKRMHHVSYLMKNGSLIVFNGKTDSNAIEMFNFATKKWVVIDNSTSDIYGQILNEIDDQIFICGGCTGSKPLIAYADCIMISLDTALISNSYQMQQSRCRICSFVIDNNIYAVGGFISDSKPSNDVQVLNLTAASPAWQKVSTYPINIATCAAAEYAGLGYVCGGYTGSATKSFGVTDECYVYNPKTDTWTSIESMNEERDYFSIIQLDGVLYSILGTGQEFYSQTVEYFNITGDRRWTVIPGVEEKLGTRNSYSVAYSWN